MSTTGSGPKPRPRATGGRRPGGPGTRRPTREEIRAAAARAAQTAPTLGAEAGGAAVAPASPRTARTTTGRSGGRVFARPVALSREEEYRFIRSDLRRMVLTAGSLLAVMLVLLVLIEL